MKKHRKILTLTFLLVVLFNILPYVTMAQNGTGLPDPDTPIDGGVSLLIAAGIGYGIKKNKEIKKRKETNNM